MKQLVVALLSNNYGAFIQSPSMGRRFDVHQSDSLLVEEGVRQTLEQVKAVTIKKINVSLPNIVILLEYRGENIEIEYTNSL